MTNATGFAERSVELDGRTVRYFEAGSGEPLVVLHGAGGVQLSGALDILARARRVIALELPGWGPQPDPGCATPAELAELVAEAIERIGVDRYQLLGTSLGGAIAVWLAAAHPDRLISLVLEAPATFREGSEPPGPAMPPEEMLRRFRAHPEREPAFAPPDPEAQARVWPLVRRVLADRPDYDEEAAALLSECAVRTLVLFGDRDGVIPPANGRTFRRLMPNCCYILVHDAAHDIHYDRPEAFAETVGDFLDRGWAFLLPETPTLINP